MALYHDAEFYKTHSAKIGPDPLREDADAEVVWQKMRNSKKPVGLILMDQSMISGIGNIYRAEILYKASYFYVRLMITSQSQHSTICHLTHAAIQ